MEKTESQTVPGKDKEVIVKPEEEKHVNPILELYREKLIEYLDHIETMVMKGVDAKVEYLNGTTRGFFAPLGSFDEWGKNKKETLKKEHLAEIERWMKAGLESLE